MLSLFRAILVTLPCCLAVPCNAQFVDVPLPQVPSSTGPFGSGQAVADFDGDGDMDVMVAPAAGGQIVYLRNDGNLNFTNASGTAQLGLHPSALCVMAADIDNDGDQDVYMGGQFRPARLYINNGAGVFSEQAVARGIVHSDDNYSATFGDFDRDGWLDLYVGVRLSSNFTTPGANRLYRNTGNGNFVDVTASAGVAGYGLSFVVVFMDYDEDGWPDLLEIRDKGTLAYPNELFRNNGDGTFTAVGSQIGVDIAVDGMGCDFTDVFNDGGVDFFCTDGSPANLFQVWDPVHSIYTDETATYGLQGNGVVWVCNFCDFNNDGWQDLYTVQENAPKNLFQNPGAPASAAQPWLDIAASVGLGHPRTQFCASIGDFNDDGLVDIFNRYNIGGLMHPNGIELLENTTNGGNWIKFRTVGRVSNRDGLGARIVIEAQGQTQRQWVRSGIGFQSSSDPRVHFGVGAASTIDRVTVTWPSGQVQHLTNVAANNIYELLEPTLTSAGPAPVGGSTTITASIPGDEGLPYLMVLSLSNTVGTSLGPNAVLPIDFDSLAALTIDPANPILVGSNGSLDAQGDASATVNIPPLPFLSGFTIYAAALTIDAPLFSFARTVIAPELPILIQ